MAQRPPQHGEVKRVQDLAPPRESPPFLVKSLWGSLLGEMTTLPSSGRLEVNVNIGSSISSLMVSSCQTWRGGLNGFRDLSAELS